MSKKIEEMKERLRRDEFGLYINAPNYSKHRADVEIYKALNERGNLSAMAKIFNSMMKYFNNLKKK